MVCSFLEMQTIRRHEECVITLFIKILMSSIDADRRGTHNRHRLDTKWHWDKTERDKKASPPLTHMHSVKANSNSGFSQGTEPSRKRSDSLRSTAVTEINKVKKKAAGEARKQVFYCCRVAFKRPERCKMHSFQ